MKRIHILSTVILFFTAFSFNSCSEVEPIDPNIIITPTPDPEDPENPSEPSAGDYWPTALNNQWVFEQNGVQQSPMKIISINSIGGNTYYTFNSSSATGTNSGATTTAVTRLRKSGANYYLKVDDLITEPAGGMPGSTTTGSETILLKDNLPVGGSWVTSYVQTTTYNETFPAISIDFLVTGTIVEKDISVTVGNETYTEVIKTRYVQKVTSFGQTTETTTYYWFAKDIGPVKISTDASGVTYNSELVSYIIN